jgi:predicted  nucleic acid-binding Zn-ribbon protein
MDVDVLKKQLAEEIQAEYETKLRDLKRDKTHAEEELENAAERWRTERRRLNSEIDRLEAALSEAKGRGRGKSTPDGKTGGISPEELAKVQHASEEKLQQAKAEWNAERERLLSQNARLERAVADAIERSSNPIRSTQAIKDQFEGKLEEAAKQRLEVEQELLRVKAAWDEDKKKLMNEILKLRRLAPSKAFAVKEKIERIHGHVESVEEARIRELEEQLTEARAETTKYHDISVKAQKELATANKELQRVQRKSSASSESNSTTTTNNNGAERIRQEYESKIQELQKQSEQARIRIKELEALAADGPSDIQKFQESTLRAHDNLANVARENDFLQRTLTETRQQLDTQQAKTQARIGELEAELEGARDDFERKRKSGAKIQEQLSLADQEIQSLRSALAETRGRASSEDVDRVREQYDLKIQILAHDKAQAETRIGQLEAELAQARKEIQRLNTASIEIQQQLSNGMKEIQSLRSLRADTREKVSAEIMDQLRRQYDSRIQDMIQQKTQLAKELESATVLLESERARFATEFSQSKSEITFDTNGLENEVQRIEEMIHVLVALIDDPSTDLSTVIRKNVEKAELSAYLRGILFSLGRAKAM